MGQLEGAALAVVEADRKTTAAELAHIRAGVHSQEGSHAAVAASAAELAVDIRGLVALVVGILVVALLEVELRAEAEFAAVGLVEWLGGPWPRVD